MLFLLLILAAKAHAHICKKPKYCSDNVQPKLPAKRMNYAQPYHFFFSIFTRLLAATCPALPSASRFVGGSDGLRLELCRLCACDFQYFRYMFECVLSCRLSVPVCAPSPPPPHPRVDECAFYRFPLSLVIATPSVRLPPPPKHSELVQLVARTHFCHRARLRNDEWINHTSTNAYQRQKTTN